MILAVTGGRRYGDRAHVFRVLDEIHRDTPVTMLVQGFCAFWDEEENRFVPQGADGLAIDWAETRGVPHTGDKYRAEWYVRGRLDRGAGPKRNKRMLEHEGVKKLAAFPGWKGTDGCVKLARALGIEVRDERTT